MKRRPNRRPTALWGYHYLSLLVRHEVSHYFDRVHFADAASVGSNFRNGRNCSGYGLRWRKDGWSRRLCISRTSSKI